MSAQMMLDLEGIVERLESWDGAVLVIRGVGGQFCAGADLRLIEGLFASAEGALWMSDWMSGLLHRLRSAPFLSFSLIEGAAMGGGAELACSTDFRILREGARLQFVQVRRGLSPGWGGAERLHSIVGRSNALRMLTGGNPVSADWGTRAGLFDWVMPADATDRELSAILAPFLEPSPGAIRTNKTAILAADGLSAKGSERDCFERSVKSKERSSLGSSSGADC